MSTLTITSKGQVTLRRELLEHLGLRVGQKIAVEALPGGRVELKADRPKGNIADAFGCLKRDDGPCLTIEEIKDLTERAWAGER